MRRKARPSAAPRLIFLCHEHDQGFDGYVLVQDNHQDPRKVIAAHWGACVEKDDGIWEEEDPEDRLGDADQWLMALKRLRSGSILTSTSGKSYRLLLEPIRKLV